MTKGFGSVCIPANFAANGDYCVQTVYPYCYCVVNPEGDNWPSICYTPKVQSWVIVLLAIFGAIVLALSAVVYIYHKKLAKIEADREPEVQIYEEPWISHQ